MNKLYCFAIVLTVVFSFCSILVILGRCTKSVSTETVEVTISDAQETYIWYTDGIVIRGTYIPEGHFAEYVTFVQYNNVEYMIEDKKIYEKYIDKIGQTAIATFKVYTLRDGTITYELVGLD